MAQKSIKTFLGKAIKENKNKSGNKWLVVEDSIQEISAAALKQVEYIQVYQSSYNDEDLCAYISLKGNKHVSFTLDRKFKGEVGDYIDPSSFRTFTRRCEELDKEVTRAFGKVDPDAIH